MAGRAAVFLDRDGTILQDPGYLHRLQDYALIRGAAEGLRALQAEGLVLVIVTNQSGIGRGYFDEAAYQALHQHLTRDLSRQGVTLAGHYFCPHRPEDACACRKPNLGLVKRAASELELDVASSWVIGDKASDMELAERAGCQGVRVLTGESLQDDSDSKSDFPTLDNLAAAAHYIIRQRRRSAS